LQFPTLFPTSASIKKPSVGEAGSSCTTVYLDTVRHISSYMEF
jgi:hypothetical protein